MAGGGRRKRRGVLVCNAVELVCNNNIISKPFWIFILYFHPIWLFLKISGNCWPSKYSPDKGESSFHFINLATAIVSIITCLTKGSDVKEGCLIASFGSVPSLLGPSCWNRDQRRSTSATGTVSRSKKMTLQIKTLFFKQAIKTSPWSNLLYKSEKINALSRLLPNRSRVGCKEISLHVFNPSTWVTNYASVT